MLPIRMTLAGWSTRLVTSVSLVARRPSALDGGADRVCGSMGEPSGPMTDDLLG